MNAIAEITKQQGAHKPGSLEFGLAELLRDMSKDTAAAELIAQDLQVETMNLKALAKHVMDYAQKNKQGNSFVMDDTTARNLIRDFYKIPHASSPAATASAPVSEIKSIFDLM